MIRPTKGLALDRALLSVGAEVLRRLDEPRTVSRLWDQVRHRESTLLESVPYDWFLLSLDFLYLCGAVDFEDGQIRRIHLISANSTLAAATPIPVPRA